MYIYDSLGRGFCQKKQPLIVRGCEVKFFCHKDRDNNRKLISITLSGDQTLETHQRITYYYSIIFFWFFLCLLLLAKMFARTIYY
jgi:hypothetical protein